MERQGPDAKEKLAASFVQSLLANDVLAVPNQVCYSLVSSTHIAAFKAATAEEKKEGLDDKRKTPHNLASLLLTNTTLRSDSRTEQRFFNNQQSISVGV